MDSNCHVIPTKTIISVIFKNYDKPKQGINAIRVYSQAFNLNFLLLTVQMKSSHYILMESVLSELFSSGTDKVLFFLKKKIIVVVVLLKSKVQKEKSLLAI